MSGTKSDLLLGALRPLTLLKGRDNNLASHLPEFLTEIRPLNLVKKQKLHRAEKEVHNENTDPNARVCSRGGKNLKPLKLARSETNKMRGILRQTEVLPHVVVRPPSESNQSVLEYRFRGD
jgi:hypothetical protein